MSMIPYTSRCANVNNCTIRPYQTRTVTFRQQTPEALEVQKLVPSMQVAELVLISSDYTPLLILNMHGQPDSAVG
jgi:hypothetical protein